MEMSGLYPAFVTLTNEKTSGTHCVGSWLGPTAGLDASENRKCITTLRITLWLGHGLDVLFCLPHGKLVNSLQHHLKLCLNESKIFRCHRCI